MSRKSLEVTGIYVNLVVGSYKLFCKNCYDKNILEVNREHGLTIDKPIFRSTEAIVKLVCEDCKETINCICIGDKEGFKIAMLSDKEVLMLMKTPPRECSVCEYIISDSLFRTEDGYFISTEWIDDSDIEHLEQIIERKLFG